MQIWISHGEAIGRIVRDHYGHLKGESILAVTLQENVPAQLDNLRTHPAVAARLARSDLKLYGRVYKIDTAEVLAYDPERGQFLASPAHPPVPALSAMPLTVTRTI